MFIHTHRWLFLLSRLAELKLLSSTVEVHKTAGVTRAGRADTLAGALEPPRCRVEHRLIADISRFLCNFQIAIYKIGFVELGRHPLKLYTTYMAVKR